MSADVKLHPAPAIERPIRLFLCGDVMTGRGIDQTLPNPCNPRLREGYLQTAMAYVRIAEEANGPIPRSVSPSYIWGKALDEFRRMRPDVSVTRCEDFASKGINYRMSPENADCLTAAGIDCCVLANNHVLDWGRAGSQTESNRRPLQCHRRDRRNSVIPPPAGTGLCWHCKATCIWTRRSW